VKQKSQSSAAFLGVLTVSEHVVGGCCIPTTIRAVFVRTERRQNPKNSGQTACWSSATRINRLSKNPPHGAKKAAAIVAAAFRLVSLVSDVPV
jgi:hypothetical protein